MALYQEFPRNFAFSLVNRMAEDITSSGISFLSKDNNITDALNERWEDLNLNYHTYMFCLRYLFFGQAVIGIHPSLIKESLNHLSKGGPISFNDISYIYNLKEYSTNPNISGVWQIMLSPNISQSLFYNNDLNLYFNNRMVNKGLYYLEYDKAPSLYQRIYPACNAMDNSIEGIGTTFKNFGTTVFKNSSLDNIGSPTAFQMSGVSSYAILNSTQRDQITMDTNSLLTNVGVNGTGVDTLHEVSKDVIAGFLNRPKGVIFGSAMGAVSSSESDNRRDSKTLESQHKKILSGFIKYNLGCLLNEKEGIIGDLNLSKEQIDSVRWTVNNFYPSTEKEKYQTLTRELDLISRFNQEFNGLPKQINKSDFWQDAFINQQIDIETNPDYAFEMKSFREAKNIGIIENEFEEGKSISNVSHRTFLEDEDLSEEKKDEILSEED